MKRGRPPLGERAMTPAEKQRRRAQQGRQHRVSMRGYALAVIRQEAKALTPTREVVNGKLATVSHLTDAWVPCAPEEATIVKVVFDDGEVLFGFRRGSR